MNFKKECLFGFFSAFLVLPTMALALKLSKLPATPVKTPSATPIVWNGSVFWNGASWSYETSCMDDGDSEKTGDHDYNMEVGTIKSILTPSSDNKTLTSSNAYVINVDIASDLQNGLRDDEEFHGEYRTYYTGVVGDKNYVRFLNNNIKVTCSDMGDCEANEEINLSDNGLTASDLTNKKAFVVLRGFEGDFMGGTSATNVDLDSKEVLDRIGTVDHTDMDNIEADDATGVQKLYVSVELDDNTVSDGIIKVIMHGAMGESDDSDRRGYFNVEYTIVIYDTSVVAISSFSVDDFESEDTHSFATDENFNVSTSVSGILPDDFDTDDGSDSENDNILGFIGLTSWGFDANDKESPYDDDNSIHRVKARAEIDKWDRTSNTTGTATIEVNGAASRYDCGTTDFDSNKEPSEMKGYLIFCKNNKVCKGTFEYTPDSTLETQAETVTIEKMGTTTLIP